MTLKERYEAICEEYRKLFLEKQDFSFSYWIADEVGGVLSCNEEYYFNMDEIRYDIDNDVEVGLILQAQNDFLDAYYKNEETKHINYKNYVRGLRYDTTK